MKISLKWLSHYVDLSAYSNDEISYALTMVGFEVERIEHTGVAPMAHVVVGEIESFEQHPNADRLSVCQINVGDGELRNIVCGAKNFKAHDRVLVALPGAVLPGDFKIKKGNLRGIKSEGMLCSARELGVGEGHEGIAILAERPDLGTPVHEAVGGDSDVVFDVEVTPNRPDALSHIGIAREMAAWFKLELSYPQLKIDANVLSGGSLIKGLEVQVPEKCPHYRGYSIRGVQVGPSPKWLQELIKAIGLRPINNVVDATNYVLHETGQPLHAFDVAKIKGGKIIVRNATDGEKITTLDEKERVLNAGMTVIADAERALVVAGVMGSLDAEVDDGSTDIFLESAYFCPKSTRKSSRQLILSTDSSYRFERGVDPKGAEFAALRCLDLIVELAGGEVVGLPLVAGEAPQGGCEIELSTSFVRERFGFDVSDEAIIESLRALELSVLEDADANGDLLLRVGIPSFRLDLYRPIDLVEEVIRIYGCDKIPAGEVYGRGLVSEDDPIARFNMRVTALLVGRGCNEVMHYSLRDGETLKSLYGHEGTDALGLHNPLASDASHLRPSLLPGLLDCVKLNQARHNEPERFFETGRVFREFGGKIFEMVSVGFVVTQKQAGRWRQREQPDFYTASKLVCDLFGTAGVKVDPARFDVLSGNATWQEGHAATFGNMKMGFEAHFGVLSAAMTRDWGIDGTVCAGSILIKPEFFKRWVKKKNYAPFSSHPPATRDLALLVDASVSAGQVASTVEKIADKVAKGPFSLESVKIFDVYLGEGIPEGKKSIALNLSFRSDERTLTDKEVDTVFDAIQQKVAETSSFEVRS